MSRGPVGETSKVNPESAQDGPYELPEGWVWMQIKEVLQPVQQFNPRATPQKIYRYVDVSSISNRLFEIEAPKIVTGAEAPTRARQAIRPGDVLFSTVRPYLRNVAMLRSESEGDVGSTAFCVLRSNGCVEPHYLYRWTLTNNFFDDLLPKQRGISYPAIRDVDVRDQLIPLAPLSEQWRIAAKIEALFEESRTARQALDRIPPLLKKFRQSVLAAAFRGDLTRDWREQRPDVEPATVLLERIRAERRRKWEEDLRAKGKDPRRTKYKEATQADHTGLEDLPGGWEYTTVIEVGRLDEEPVLTGPFGAQLPSKEFVSEGVPVIAIGNVAWGGFCLDKVAHVTTEKVLKLTRYTLEPGDVLFTRSGTIGRSTVVPEYAKGWLMSYHLLRVRVQKSVCDPMYLYFVFRGLLTIQDQISETARGATRPGFNTTLLKRLQFPLPPMDEQQQIVSRIEDLFARADAIETAAETAKRHAAKLDQSILARAFRGELVPQDPNDEPASVLLHRIRAERVIGRG